MDREIEQFKKQKEIEKQKLEKKFATLKIKELDIKNDRISREIITFEAKK